MNWKITRMWAALGVLALGLVVGVATYATADTSDGSHDIKDPDVPSPLTVATPTATVDVAQQTDIDRAREQFLSADGLKALDTAITRGESAVVADRWVTHTMSCFVGSERTGGFCADSAAPVGTEVQVQVVNVDLWGITIPAELGREIVLSVLDGNPGRLVFLSHWDDGDLVLGYDIGQTASEHFGEAHYLHLVVGRDGLVKYLSPLQHTPLEEWRNFDRSITELIAVDDTLIRD